jgi:hypothetical protein
VHEITRRCGGCMYGSFPEMTIAARWPFTTLRRTLTFLGHTRVRKPWPLTTDQLLEIIGEINAAHPVAHARASALLESVPRHADVTRSLPVIQ